MASRPQRHWCRQGRPQRAPSWSSSRTWRHHTHSSLSRRRTHILLLSSLCTCWIVSLHHHKDHCVVQVALGKVLAKVLAQATIPLDIQMTALTWSNNHMWRHHMHSSLSCRRTRILLQTCPCKCWNAYLHHHKDPYLVLGLVKGLVSVKAEMALALVKGLDLLHSTVLYHRSEASAYHCA